MCSVSHYNGMCLTRRHTTIRVGPSRWGKGVFARRALAADVCIAKYAGELSCGRPNQDRVFDAHTCRYTLRTRQYNQHGELCAYYIDASNPQRSDWTRYAQTPTQYNTARRDMYIAHTCDRYINTAPPGTPNNLKFVAAPEVSPPSHPRTNSTPTLPALPSTHSGGRRSVY
jgi:hypothetical protein